MTAPRQAATGLHARDAIAAAEQMTATAEALSRRLDASRRLEVALRAALDLARATIARARVLPWPLSRWALLSAREVQRYRGLGQAEAAPVTTSVPHVHGAEP